MEQWVNWSFFKENYRFYAIFSHSYALSIFENANLARLWPVNENKSMNLVIKKGTVQFQNNPQLCYKTVFSLIDNINIAQNATILDVSKYSNGHKAICKLKIEQIDNCVLKSKKFAGEELKINLRVVYFDHHLIVLQWDVFNTTVIDFRMFLGYMLYHREVDTVKVSIYENRDLCFDRCYFLSFSVLLIFQIYVFISAGIWLSKDPVPGAMLPRCWNLTKCTRSMLKRWW